MRMLEGKYLKEGSPDLGIGGCNMSNRVIIELIVQEEKGVAIAEKNGE